MSANASSTVQTAGDSGVADSRGVQAHMATSARAMGDFDAEFS